MARKRYQEEPASDLAGTVEGLAADHFEREKAAYEQRTGQTVEYVPGLPATRTPIASEEPSEDGAQNEEEIPTEGDQINRD